MDVLGILLILAVWLGVCGGLTGAVGKARGHSFWLFFLMGALISPLLGIILAFVIQPPRQTRRRGGRGGRGTARVAARGGRGGRSTARRGDPGTARVSPGRTGRGAAARSAATRGSRRPVGNR